MPSVAQRVAHIRERRPLIDHLVRMQEHYSAVKAGVRAGAVTYFAFLSFFPILALAFFVVGWIAKIYPDARETFTAALDSVMPGLIGSNEGQIQLDEIQKAAATLGIVGAVVLLYTGLRWLTAMRDTLLVIFEVPAKEQPGFVAGLLRDLLTLILIGVILLVSVAVTALVGGFSNDVLDWLGLGEELSWLVRLVTVVLGLFGGMLLFYSMFVLLAQPRVPRRSLWSGALLGAVAFEILKQLSAILFRSTQGSPAFQAFGIALIVLLWINYTSRLVLYAAAWAHTSRAARAVRVEAVAAPVEGPPSPPLRHRGSEAEHPWAASYVAGAVTMLTLVAVVRRLTRSQSRKDS